MDLKKIIIDNYKGIISHKTDFKYRDNRSEFAARVQDYVTSSETIQQLGYEFEIEIDSDGDIIMTDITLPDDCIIIQSKAIKFHLSNKNNTPYDIDINRLLVISQLVDYILSLRGELIVEEYGLMYTYEYIIDENIDIMKDISPFYGFDKLSDSLGDLLTGFSTKYYVGGIEIASNDISHKIFQELSILESTSTIFFECSQKINKKPKESYEDFITLINNTRFELLDQYIALYT